MGIFDRLNTDIFKKFSFGKKGESVLGVDISSSTIKLVQAKKENNQGVLETYGELALGPYTGMETGRATNLEISKVAEALVDLMKESKVTTKNAGVAIPVSSSLINVLELPDVGENKLKEMVPLEMRKYVPVPISEVVMDWKVIPKSHDEEEVKKEKKVSVFVAAVHKDTINRYHEIIKEAGLNASFFEIEVFSSIRSIVDDSRNPSMIIDFGAGTTKIYIVDNGIIRDSHIINKGSQDINISLSKSMGLTPAKAEEIKRTQGLSSEPANKNNYKVSTLVVESVLKEAGRVMVNFEKRYNKIIDKAYLSGGGAILKGFPEFASKTLDAEVIVGSPFDKLKYPAFLEDTLKLAGPEFAVAVGALMRKLEES